MPEIIDLRREPAPTPPRRTAAARPSEEETLLPVTEATPAKPPPRRSRAHPTQSAFEPLTDSSVTFLTWETPSAEPKLPLANPLVTLGALLVAGGLVAFALANFLFAFFLLLAGGVVASYQFRPPRSVEIAITSRGIRVGRRIYEFESLESFWIFYDPPLMKELSVLSKKTFMPPLRLPLGDLDPVLVRETLLRFLRERQQDRSMIDIVSRGLGF